MNFIIAVRAFAFALVFGVIAVMAAPAGAQGWRDHVAPFDFLFGNHIDTHQQTKLRSDGDLSGALFVYFTGEIDGESGLPVARHPRGAAHGEECGFDVDCVAGWRLRARPGQATFLFHSGVNGDDHPVWLVGRGAIPQPGGFTHFHWIASAGTEALLTGAEIPPACDVETAGALEGTVADGTLTLDDGAYSWDQESVHVGGGAETIICPGWFLELKAVESFAFQHGGETIPVYPGADNATHLNLLGNYALVPGLDVPGTGH